MDASPQHADGRHDDGRHDDAKASATEAGNSSTEDRRTSEGEGALKRVLSPCVDCYVPRRYVIVFLLFLGMCFVHAERVNIGVTVVSIVDERHELAALQIAQSQDNSSVTVIIRQSSVRSITSCYDLLYPAVSLP